MQDGKPIRIILRLSFGISRFMKTLSFFLASLLMRSLAFADLQWEKKELEFSPAITDTSLKAEFRFTNTGRKPVVIASVKSSCGCTTAVPDKTTYGPGEQGLITAVFTFGQRSGRQNKQVGVTFKGEPAATMLSIIAHLPELVKVSPRLVFWRTGDAPEAKTIEVTVEGKAPVRVKKVTSSDPSVKVALETVEEGRSYKVVVTPQQTAAPVSSLLSIETEVAPRVQQLFSAYAHVKMADASRPKIRVIKSSDAAPSGVGDEAGAR